MKGQAIFLIALTGFIVVYGQTTVPTICWNSTYFNNSAPTKTNRSEYEQQSAKVLDSVCTNGPIIAARCKDSKGEPFTGFRNDSVIKYIARCDVINGLICNPYNTSIDAICPDFQIQYGCNCPSTTQMTSRGGVSSSKDGDGSGSGSGLRGDGSGSGSGLRGNDSGSGDKTNGMNASKGVTISGTGGNSKSATGSNGTGNGSENSVQRNCVSYSLLLICAVLKYCTMFTT